MNLRRTVMGLGLKALNRLAALPGMDQPARRRKLTGFLKRASHAGFKTALAVNRTISEGRALSESSSRRE